MKCLPYETTGPFGSPVVIKVTLSPPDYSVLEDLSSGELRSRTQQKWPERPESGRYSLQYGYFDEKLLQNSTRKTKAKE
ncbi:hypothetical protein KIN20_007382 [Parelaphostrongylus tenuis]|uniref:Uncharacterized protein n=1 Tax=Parelaphostrongylus tenuis TaxID=148309 RepID=A0AAD5MVH3_PARTN|nr:hypothetical protein KIN20_007382 [Parelaphostrongylus tenuis]